MNRGDKGGDPLPLAGIRVLDLSSRVGAYCGKLLADLGADVLKVERPGGDQLRRLPPYAPAPGKQGLLFAWYHNNQRGITLDWTHSDAIALLAELAAPADVVIVSPDVREPLAGFEAPPSRPSWLPEEYNALRHNTLWPHRSLASLASDAVHVVRRNRPNAHDGT